MVAPLPDSYRRLGQFAERFPPDAVIYEQGTVPPRCFVVLKGRVDFEIVGDDGEPQTVGSASPGEPLGHFAFFTGRPTSALARAAEDSVVLAIDREDLAQVISHAPELALMLIDAFATGGEHRQHTQLDAGPTRETPPEAEEEEEEGGVVELGDEYDNSMFFVDTVSCPVSGTRFQYLRVRTRAVRPTRRDTDFHVRYRDMDPTHYAIVVCPRCAYAASQDDFQQLGQDERIELWATRRARIARLEGRSVCGVRSIEDAVTALELAMHCYELRRPNERRRAVLLHRRAWIERERGDGPLEQDFLRQARDSYQAAYERDTDISDDAAMRAAYLIGDLTLRLGDAVGGARWLETSTRYPQASKQTGLARMARERLMDARKMLAEQTKNRRAG